MLFMKNFLIKSLKVSSLFLFLFLPFLVKATEINIENLDNIPITNDFLLEQGKIELLASPGDLIQKQVSIINRSGKKVKFHLIVEDIFSDNNSRLFFSTVEPTFYSLRSLIKLKENFFYLDHGQRAIIPIEIKIPNDIQVGGLYGAITFIAPVSSSLETRLSSLIFINIKNQAKPVSKLGYFISSKKIFFNEPINFEFSLTNQGNVILSPKGKIKINNLLNSNNKEITLDEFYVIPESSRHQNYFLKDLYIGFYQAQLELETFNNNIISAKTYFIVLNFEIIVFLIFFSLLLIWIFYNKKIKLKSNENI